MKAPPMSKKIDRQQSIVNLRQEAQRRVLKNEVMKFRLESETLERLLLLAKKLDKPAGTLVREWVVERLDQLEGVCKSTPEFEAISIIANTLAQRGLLSAEKISRINKLLGQDVHDSKKRR